MDAYTVNWLNDAEKAVIMDMAKGCTWQDFDDAVKQAHAKIESKTDTIPLLIRVQEQLPDGNPVMHFSRAARNQPANVGKIIIIVPSMVSLEMRLMSRVLKIMKKVFPGKQFVEFVGSYDEAVALATDSGTAQMGA